ncbi:MAG: hypothetical protein C0469_11475, partial [Cyanobacteria bacterium DS2.3.42]|nr:hypothetical protein [Cyanobacteria bacterium DS2.3.42]
MGEWRGPGTLFVRWQSLSRIYSLVAFMMVAWCPLALISIRPLECVLVLLICARVFYQIGKHFSESASLAMIGAIGEDDVAAVLQKLPSAWKVERNIPVESGGDIDFLVTSPENTIFVLDAKAHSGTVVYDGVRLSRKVKGKRVPFEKDILSKVKQQAVQIRTERKLPFVNPVLVFTRAELQLSSMDTALVKVLTTKDLLSHLLSSTKAGKPKIVVRSHLQLVADKKVPKKVKSFSQADQIKMLAKQSGIVPLERSYSIRLHDCWNCHNRIFVLDWPNHKKWDPLMPPLPVPKTIQLRHSQVTGEEHWANTCFLCGQIQGDYYIFEDSSPFQWFSPRK